MSTIHLIKACFTTDESLDTRVHAIVLGQLAVLPTEPDIHGSINCNDMWYKTVESNILFTLLHQDQQLFIVLTLILYGQ